jgi:hypothetical protein
MRRAIRAHKRLTAFLAVAVPLVLVLAAWHYWTLYSSLADARAQLLSAQARLSDVGLNLTDADLAVAREQLRAADANLRRADDHLTWDPLIRLAGVLPGTGPQVDATEDLVDIGGLLVEVGDRATTAAGKAVALKEAPPSDDPLTASLVDLLADTSEDVDAIAALAAEIVEARAEIGDRALLPPLARAVDRLDEELPQLANAVEQLAQSKALLPAFLGFEGDRNYLVFALNNGELLPGGGLVTASGVLPVSQGVNGELDFTDSTLWKSMAEARSNRSTG